LIAPYSVENLPRRSGRKIKRKVGLSELKGDEFHNDNHHDAKRKKKQREQESETQKRTCQQRDQQLRALSRLLETLEERRERQQRDLPYHHNILHVQVPLYLSGHHADNQLEKFELDCLSAQLKFSNNCGLDIMNQAIGTSNKRRQALLQYCGKIREDELSERIAAYNMKMNAALDIEACAACFMNVVRS